MNALQDAQWSLLACQLLGETSSLPLPRGRRDADLLASVRGILRGELARGPCVLADRALLVLLVLLLGLLWGAPRAALPRA